jgi:adenine-specific DNA-methyltransferase
VQENLSQEEIQEQLIKLKTENKFLKNQLEEISQGGIKILFSGKANAQRIARKVKPRTLREIKSLSINPEENSHNLVIEGDNLKAMITLYQYHGKIDLIIADPPYNTGKDFRYNDRWDEDPNDPGLGDYVKADDPSRHTKWMKFMLPRIQMMRSMLKNSGVLAFCIDERELFRLGMILDEVFNEKNRIAIINWQKLGGPKTYTHVSPATEYILVYAKDIKRTKTSLIPRTDEYLKQFKNPDNDPRGPWIADNSGSQTPTYSMVYAIQNPFTGNLCEPPMGSCWRFAKSRMKSFLESWGSEYEEIDIKDGKSPALLIKDFSLDNLQIPSKDPIIKASSKKAYEIYEKGPWPKIIFSRQGKGKPQQKRYLVDMKEGHVPITYWGKEDYENPIELGVVSWDLSQSGTTSMASSEISHSVGRGHGFETAKPLKLFTKIIQLWCPPNGLVLDPFAGSGTTGHAVLQLNKETGTNRSFILIETGNEENQDNYCRTLLQKRLQAAITGKWADKKEHEPLNGNFTFHSLNKAIDAQTLLEMKRDDLIDAILASQMENQWTRFENYSYLIAKSSENEGIFLIWNGNSKSQLTQEIYYQIVQEAQQANLSSEKYIVWTRLCSFRPENLEFKQIPSEVLAGFRVFD